MHRWAIHFSPMLIERFNRCKRAITGKWNADETKLEARGCTWIALLSPHHINKNPWRSLTRCSGAGPILSHHARLNVFLLSALPVQTNHLSSPFSSILGTISARSSHSDALRLAIEARKIPVPCPYPFSCTIRSLSLPTQAVPFAA